MNEWKNGLVSEYTKSCVKESTHPTALVSPGSADLIIYMSGNADSYLFSSAVFHGHLLFITGEESDDD